MIGEKVDILNQQIIGVLEDGIQAQKKILANLLSCKLFLTTYPMLINHITNESEHYLMQLQALQHHQVLTDEPKGAAMDEIFWNHKMAEHARIGYGLLDPSEEVLIQRGGVFAVEFDELTRAAEEACERPEFLPEVTGRSMTATINIRSWKEEITRGLLKCKTRSRMPPLIAEHVMREANHFLKELRAIELNLGYSQK